MKANKPVISVLGALGIALGAQASDYPLLRITRSDGSCEHISTESLRLAFSDGSMMLQSAGGNASFATSALSSLRFVRSTAGITDRLAADSDASVEVFASTGISAGCFGSIEEARAALAPGIYIIRQGNNYHKIAIR